MGTPVTTIEEFKRKWGTKSLGLLISRYIQDAPEFTGDGELAAHIGEAIADLEGALQTVVIKVPCGDKCAHSSCCTARLDEQIKKKSDELPSLTTFSQEVGDALLGTAKR